MPAQCLGLRGQPRRTRASEPVVPAKPRRDHLLPVNLDKSRLTQVGCYELSGRGIY